LDLAAKMLMCHIYKLLEIVLVFSFCKAIVHVRKSTDLGDILGFRHKTDRNNYADVFLGVPFAISPVGSMRFKVTLKYSCYSL